MAKKMTKEQAIAQAKKAAQQAQGLTKTQIKIIVLLSVALAGMFMPTTLLISVGMLPTIVAFVVQKKEMRIRVLTVGAMNMAGCAPFLLDLWLEGHNFQNSFGILFSPMTIVIMYFCAAVGYVIDWAATEFVSSILYERGVRKKDDLKEYLEGMVERWGEKVTGRLELDDDGFPFDDR